MAWEIRWFGSGTVPDDVARLFDPLPRSGGQVTREGRTDSYVVVAAQDGIGIKLRDTTAGNGEPGKFEVKVRLETANASVVAGRATGVAERWRKVSWKYAPDDQRVVDALIEQGLGGELVDVEKERWQWKFVPDSDELSPIDFEQKPSRACLLEQTALEIRGEPFWSIGLDAFDEAGAEAALDALERGCGLALGGYGGEALAVTASLGYPGYLLRLGA